MDGGCAGRASIHDLANQSKVPRIVPLACASGRVFSAQLLAQPIVEILHWTRFERLTICLGNFIPCDFEEREISHWFEAKPLQRRNGLHDGVLALRHNDGET
jgi:hypothetical protein